MAHSIHARTSAEFLADAARRAAHAEAQPHDAGACDAAIAAIEAGLVPDGPPPAPQPATVYHPATVRAVRVYQSAGKARLAPYSEADAAEDYAGALEYAASEPGGLHASPCELVRRSMRLKAGQALALCRRARRTMATGAWRGENAPMDLAEAQARLWHARDYRRAFYGAAADHAIAAIGSAIRMPGAVEGPAMVPQVAQLQQACAAMGAGARPVQSGPESRDGITVRTLDAHCRATGIDHGGATSTALFHVLCDVLTLCEARGLSFDAIVSEARDCLAEG